jgi:hypothetical protein
LVLSQALAEDAGQQIYELRLNKLNFGLRNPLESRKSRKTYLTQIHANGVSMRFYPEEPFGLHLQKSKDSLKQSFLEAGV